MNEVCRAGRKEREVQRLSFDVTSDGIPEIGEQPGDGIRVLETEKWMRV